MATVGLSVVGSAIGGTLGGPVGAIAGRALGGALGAYIDGTFILPRIFGQDELQPPAIQDLEFQTAEEGSPTYRLYGEGGRISPTIVWKSEVLQETTSTGGGKGAGSQTQAIRTASVDVQIALCDGAIEEVERILADGQVIYDTSKASASLAQVRGTNTPISGQGIYLKVESLTPTKGTANDFENFKVGTYVDTTGWTNAANNGTFGVGGVSTLSDGKQEILLFNPAAVTEANAPYSPPVTLDVNLTVGVRHWSASIVDDVSVHPAFEAGPSALTDAVFSAAEQSISSATFNFPATFQLGRTLTITGTGAGGANDADYEIMDFVGTGKMILGDGNVQDLVAGNATLTQSQVVDPTVDAGRGNKGVRRRGNAHVVFTKLRLRNYGNRIPQMSCILRKRTGATVLEVVQDILKLAGVTQTDLNGVPTTTLRGLTVRGAAEPARILQPIMLAFDLLGQEGSGSLRIFERQNAEIVVLDETYMGAHQLGQNPPQTAQLTRIDDVERPNEVTVRFQNADFDYQTSTEVDRLAKRGERRRIRPIELGPLALGNGEGRQLATRILWDIWGGRFTCRADLMPRDSNLLPGDVIRFSKAGQSWDFLLTQVDLNPLDFRMRVQGVQQLTDTRLLTTGPAIPPETLAANRQVLRTVLPTVRAEVLDVGPLSDAHLTSPGVYCAIGAGYGSEWSGGAVFESRDGGSSYDPLCSALGAATIGYAQTVLATGTVDVWDRSSKVEVVVPDTVQLESRSEADVLNGANRCVIGSEVLAYQTATLIGHNTYELSVLARGLLDTWDEIGSHVVGERFVLDDDSVQFVDGIHGDVGVAVKLKAVTSGGSFDDVDPVDLTYEGSTIRPFAPMDIAGSRNATNDLAITWTRRTRADVRVLEQVTPLLESAEEYEVDLLNNTTEALLRTLTVTGSTTVTYDNGDQETDGITPGDPVIAVVYQMGALGRGKGRQATV